MSLFSRLSVLACLVIALAGPSLSSDVLTYQGRLLDASGNPVADNTYSIRFRIYDAPMAGNLLWIETNPAVQTSAGLFSVRLGELAALDLGSLGSDNLYLEIQVALGAPMTPRTLLTSSPRAAVAGKVKGDLETAPGVLTIKRSDGDSTVSIRSFDGGISMRMFDPQPEPPGKAVVEMSADVSSGAGLKLFDPQPEPPGKAIEFLTGTLGSSAPTFRMFDPQPEPPGKLFEIVANAGSGPSMSFFNQAGQVMGVEPSPFNNGFSMKLFDPQPEPPGKMLEIGTSYYVASPASAAEPTGSGDTAWIKTYGPATINGEPEMIYMYSTDTDAELRLGQGAPLGSATTYISAKSTGSESRITLEGPMGPTVSSIVLSATSGISRVGIGTSTPTQSLHVVGNICYTGTIGACSDGKYKKNVERVDHALDLVSEIEGVRYQWKADQYPEQQFSAGTQIGFVAQDVKKVLPEVVMEQPDGSLSIDYGRLTPVLLEAIKELKLQNQQLTRRIEVLEAK